MIKLAKTCQKFKKLKDNPAYMNHRAKMTTYFTSSNPNNSKKTTKKQKMSLSKISNRLNITKEQRRNKKIQLK